MRNLTLAIRMLRKTPFVTAVAVLSLALGIGANAAIFSMFDQILMKRLPVPEPTRLINISNPGPRRGSTSCNQSGSCDEILSYPMFKDLEAKQTVLSGLAGFRIFGASVAMGDEPSVGDGHYVSGSYFPTLGIQPLLGRLITPADDDVPGAHPVVVITHRFWTERFDADPAAVGKTLSMNGRAYEIIGVTQQGFKGTTFGSEPLLFVPITMRPSTESTPIFEDRRVYWVYVFGRLNPGVTPEAAKAALDGIVGPILAEVEAPIQREMSEQTMTAFKAKKVVIADGRRGMSSIHEESKTPLLMLFSITGVVLLIACANIANLLLARGATRSTEMGVRLALGASRRQLMTQLLTESVVLALAGGVVSLLVAKWTLDAIQALLPADAVASFQFTLQPIVLVFSGALAIATGLVFGLFPALHSTRADLISAIRAGAGQLTGGRGAARFRATLVTVQIALSMALLVSAGLFLKSLSNASRVDLGVKVDSVATFGIAPLRTGYDTVSAKVLYARIEEELRTIPGTTGVTSSMVALLTGNNWGTDVRVQGFECGPDTDCNSSLNQVGAGYFATMGIPILAGRDFTEADQEGGAKVVIVNETFARKFNIEKDAVGKYIAIRGNSGVDTLNVQIVGLVKDSRYSEVKDTIPPVFYTPWRQESRVSFMNFYLRSGQAPEQVLGAVPTVMKRIDAAIPVEQLMTMPQVIRENLFLDRMISTLSASFAILATLLAGVGLYGVLAFSVSQRTREIGVRMALGADSANVQRMVLKQLGALVAIGALVGVAAALGLGRVARSLLFELKGHDPTVFALAVILLALVALAAGLIPARRASQTDPMHALRYD